MVLMTGIGNTGTGNWFFGGNSEYWHSTASWMVLIGRTDKLVRVVILASSHEFNFFECAP